MKKWLQGSWVLERDVEDLRLQQGGKMRGQGDFSPWQNGLFYKEQALFTFGTYQDIVSQSYLYSFSSQSCAEVYFMDGRLFYSLDLSDGQTQVRFDCGADVYVGTSTVLSPTCLSTNWSIKGPKKKIITKTHFYKL